MLWFLNASSTAGSVKDAHFAQLTQRLLYPQQGSSASMQ